LVGRGFRFGDTLAQAVRVGPTTELVVIRGGVVTNVLHLGARSSNRCEVLGMFRTADGIMARVGDEILLWTSGTARYD